MTNAVLEARGVFKRFRRGEIHDSLRDLLPALMKRTRRSDLDSRDFWALQDISFEVAPGEAFGIIGNNGAGKSTLLKLLCSILIPTKGELVTRGRLSALVEVGAGFHKDLTGRENIFMNGTILGMSRSEIRQKFDAIVAFSELEEFIDTPIKRYSSGMYARLGFSVAAHVDPDILVVDEVLSVGDWQFQSKSTEKMRQIMTKGTTVVFVSHDLRTVADLCNRAMLIERGRIAAIGPAQEVIKSYISRGKNQIAAADQDKDVYISKVTLRDQSEREALQFEARSKMIVEVEVTARRDVKDLAIVIVCLNEQLFSVFHIDEQRLGAQAFSLKAGSRHVTSFGLTLNLAPGAYHFRINVHRYNSERTYDSVSPVATFYVRSDVHIRGVADLEPRLLRYEEVPAN